MNEYAVNLYYSEGTFEMKLEGMYYQYSFHGALTEQLSRAEVTRPHDKSLETGEFRTPKANVDLECGVDSRQLGSITYDKKGRYRDLETALMKEYRDETLYEVKMKGDSPMLNTLRKANMTSKDEPSRFAKQSTCYEQNVNYASLQSRDIDASGTPKDKRSVTNQELHAKVEEATNLGAWERQDLFRMLCQYQKHFTAKPGKCTLMKYKFEMENSELIVGSNRVVPFSVRKEVREQLNQLLEDKVIEPSNSGYLNPLTIVLRDGKPRSICLDVRKVNKYMRPDQTRVPPIQELLQRFHGSKYISTIDLSSAFLQAELTPESRKYTAFLFDSQFYQYTRTPCGSKIHSQPLYVH
jgi:hypothetical protein